MKDKIENNSQQWRKARQGLAGRQQIEEKIFRFAESRDGGGAKNASNIDGPTGKYENTAECKNAANSDRASAKYHKTPPAENSTWQPTS